MDSNYARAKSAKAHVHEVDRSGWPDSAMMIRWLVQDMSADDRLVCLCGRFVRKRDGRWRFMFPATTTVIEALDGERTVDEEIVFIEDMDG